MPLSAKLDSVSMFCHFYARFASTRFKIEIEMISLWILPDALADLLTPQVKSMMVTSGKFIIKLFVIFLRFRESIEEFEKNFKSLFIRLSTNLPARS